MSHTSPHPPVSPWDSDAASRPQRWLMYDVLCQGWLRPDGHLDPSLAASLTCLEGVRPLPCRQHLSSPVSCRSRGMALGTVLSSAPQRGCTTHSAPGPCGHPRTVLPPHCPPLRGDPQREERPVGARGLSRAGGSTCHVPAGSEGAQTTPRRSCSTASSLASCGRTCMRRRCVHSPVHTHHCPCPLPAALPQAHRVCTAGSPPELCARTSLRPSLGRSYVGMDSPDRAPCARHCLLKPGSAVGALVPLSHSLPQTSVPPAAGRAQACCRSAQGYAGPGHSTCLSGAGGRPSQE